MTPTTRVLRWEVPVDDGWHPIGPGPVVLVGDRDNSGYQTGRTVEVWTLEPAEHFHPPRPARVYGTGHPVPGDVEHIGSVITAGGRLVWHVFADPVPPHPDTQHYHPRTDTSREHP